MPKLEVKTRLIRNQRSFRSIKCRELTTSGYADLSIFCVWHTNTHEGDGGNAIRVMVVDALVWHFLSIKKKWLFAGNTNKKDENFQDIFAKKKRAKCLQVNL